MVLILDLVIILKIVVIRFDTDDTLPLDAMVSVYSMTIVIRSVFRDYYDRFYTQIYLANCIYKNVRIR